ncbi:Endonuclease/Exonuclease/phosphatase family protein [Histomonas meleagridis]|uniref:Endonuclease/Exonuclease/phosphatase family protein n=1 Tax=Histomonas meleagridis TaxID=135588 RepID=UPI00355973B3|nr:Endonuclease/Exonuclease/phosphatase family protein [Histomonas meleagridis]KAH0798321.1 Endonuclease/Exonuclease/phosphatase family protein [Histomonas meleagridis]
MHGLNLTWLPSEIGLCVDLEVLDIRDNCLTFLPPELSQCLKLKTLLFSGNNIEYKTQMQALIELRKYNQASAQSPQMKWTTTASSISIISWNITAQQYAIPSNFPKCPSRYLKWEHRAQSFLNNITNLKPSLLCVQDIEEEQLSFISDQMRTIGYGYVSSFANRPRKYGAPRTGVATFYLKSRAVIENNVSVSFSDLPENENISKLQLISNDDVFQISYIRYQTKSYILVNAGLHNCKYEPEVLLSQVYMIAEHIDSLQSQVIFCGSLGFEPNSDEDILLKHGKDPNNKFTLKRTYRNAYDEHYGDVEFTKWDNEEFAVNDYIFITNMLSPIGHLTLPSKDEALKYHYTAPNAQWPSCHMPIGAVIETRAFPNENN